MNSRSFFPVFHTSLVVLLCGAMIHCAASTRLSHPSGTRRASIARVAATDVGNVPASTTGIVARESPPPSGPRRDIHFPPIARTTLPNGLEINVVEYHSLPVLHVRLVVRGAGAAADPPHLPGLAAFTADMLKEGTRRKTSAQIAETIEFVGGTLAVDTTVDATIVSIAVLKEHAETALSLLAELVTEPTFPPQEIDKLRRREIDRLAQMQQDPGWLSRRMFYPLVYGDHPYARFDTTAEALERISRNDLVQFHRARFVAGSMFVAVVGDVRAAEFNSLAARILGRIRRGTAPALRFPAIPVPTGRRIVIVDRPNSAQSVIRIGNVALRRSSEDYIPAMVANHILGGEASSRLFMDLRERRSLTYGAYSRITANVDPGTFQATASVRTPVTGQALAAFFEHLDRIVREPPSPQEVEEAQSFLIDSFPLTIETPGDMAGLLVDLRLYGLPDDYWDTYRARIAEVTPTQALEIAQRYIHPDRAAVVLVGNATAIENDARRFGPVRVVDVNGRTLRELPPLPPETGTATSSQSSPSPPAHVVP